MIGSWKEFSTFSLEALSYTALWLVCAWALRLFGCCCFVWCAATGEGFQSLGFLAWYLKDVDDEHLVKIHSHSGPEYVGDQS